jgi:hypothetical protein
VGQFRLPGRCPGRRPRIRLVKRQAGEEVRVGPLEQAALGAHDIHPVLQQPLEHDRTRSAILANHHLTSPVLVTVLRLALRASGVICVPANSTTGKYLGALQFSDCAPTRRAASYLHRLAASHAALAGFEAVRLFSRKPTSEDLDRVARQMVLELDTLDPDTRSRTVAKLQFLFALLKERYGTLGDFLQQTPVEQESYLQQLTEAAQHASSRGQASKPYVTAARLLRVYLKALCEERSGPGLVELARRVVELLDAPETGS